MFLLKRLLPLLIIIYSVQTDHVFGVQTTCKICVFDCGQGNVVAAKYNKQTMIFDAGRTAYAQFVKYEDDRSSESTVEAEYSITEVNRPLRYLTVDQAKYDLVAVGNNKKNKEAYKEFFEKSFKEFVFDEDCNTLKAVFISHPDGDHYNLVKEFGLDPNVFVLGGKFNLYSQAFKKYVKAKPIVEVLPNF